MSDVGGSGSTPPGAWTDPRDPYSEDHAIVAKVKEQYEKKTKTNPKRFVAILARSQVVNGINYLFKVDIGEDTCSHLFVFKPLPYEQEKIYLMAFQLHKKIDDKLEPFHKER